MEENGQSSPSLSISYECDRCCAGISCGDNGGECAAKTVATDVDGVDDSATMIDFCTEVGAGIVSRK